MTVCNISIGNYNPMCCATALADDGYNPSNTWYDFLCITRSLLSVDSAVSLSLSLSLSSLRKKVITLYLREIEPQILRLTKLL